ncbi:MAG: hypothetical protein PX637_11775 [Microcystis sp. M53601_WE4]|nr:hypothetical protein [Microcystis sp. M53601_WE4]
MNWGDHFVRVAGGDGEAVSLPYHPKTLSPQNPITPKPYHPIS